MKHYIYLLIVLFCFKFGIAQTSYKKFNSTRLGEERELKIQLPRNYNVSDKSYPIIVVLDAEHMFEIVASNVDYASYWDDVPESIIVGINQLGKRDEDNLYSKENSLLIETGIDFFEFINMELIPYIEKTYRTEKFKVIIGHGDTANFVNYPLLKEEPMFNAYISISPYLASNMTASLTQKLPAIQNKIFYYLATSNNDVKSIQKETKALNKAIQAVGNKNILSSFDYFEDLSHYSIPARAIPKALEAIFFNFRPISKKDYKETISKLQTSPVNYLNDKYKTIEDLYGIKKVILINDFKVIAKAIQKSKKFEYFEPLSALARKHYPNTLLGSYYLGRFNEEAGNAKKAMKIYQSAYLFEEIGGITKNHVLELSDQIKKDFGY